MFIYYNERLLDNNEMFDTGSSVRNGLKVLYKQGVCKEKLCKYDISKFSKIPSVYAYENAKLHKIIKYLSVNPTVVEFKTALSTGRPIIFGFIVKPSFNKIDNTGMLLYNSKEEEDEGGHAVICYGYDDNLNGKGGHLKILNSWGEKWGDNGKFYMPYEYLESGLCSDAWVLIKNINN
jgi:C1A family cysteine protease